MNPTRKILIVDDAGALRGVLRAILTGDGHRVVGELARGAGLADAVASLKPDLVCLDHSLPDSNGLDLLKELSQKHPDLLVVMITGNLDPALQTGAMEAGAAGFITKPFSPGQVTDLVRRLAREGKPQPRAALDLGKSRGRAIVADDSASMRAMLISYLIQAGVDVAGEAADGQKAVELALQVKPDLVCLDLDMPVMGGLEALEQIHARCPASKVIIVSAHADRVAITEAVKRGAKGYIIKPFQPDRINAAIDKLLA